MAIVGAFVMSSLCCRARENRLTPKIKVLLLMPFLTTLLTGAVALYYLTMHDWDQCIYFGSTVAMLAIDLENQIIFLVGVFFVNTMRIVLLKTSQSLRPKRDPQGSTDKAS